MAIKFVNKNYTLKTKESEYYLISIDTPHENLIVSMEEIRCIESNKVLRSRITDVGYFDDKSWPSYEGEVICFTYENELK